LLLGSGAGVLGYSGYATLHQPWALILVGMTCVAVASVCFSQLFAHVRETYAGDTAVGSHSSLVVSMVRVCFSVAWTAGPATGALVLAAFGFSGLFSAAAGLYLLFFTGVWRFVPSAALPRVGGGAATPPVRQALAQGNLLACFLAFAAIFAAHAMNMMNLPLFITQELGGSARELGVAFGIGPVVEIPLMLWIGHLATPGNRFRLIRIGVVATAAYFLALSLAAKPWHVFPIQVLSGLSFAILTNIAILFFQDLLPRQLGLATSVFANAGNAGNLVGFFLFGGLLELFGHRGLLLGCALLCGIAFGLLTLVRSARPT
jgi:SET family sugar efflux transporter-like MFS transporter